MSAEVTLHDRLISRQSDAELERKWAKAQGRWANQYWSQEWLDVAHRRALRLYDSLHWENKQCQPR